ncbi:MAG: hypothetical protein VX702_08665 [Pseudomonadota bacterium]|nr:hypothetical protein [Pseudomonadota bacterium]
MKYVLSVICGFLAIAGSPERGHAHNEIAQLVPSPGCIQTILNQDTRVDAAQCLVELAALDAREGRTHDGLAYPVAEVQTDQYRMMIHYTGGSFPDAALNNWPLSIDLNFGGSGWFSYLMVLVETRAAKIGSGFVQQAGDRCNDGHARWDRFSENGNGVYMRSATPFRLVNPLDELNWRAVDTAMMFDGKDDNERREEMLTLADPPLYQSWLPYQDLENCAICCAGEIVVMQNMIGTEIEPGRDHGVIGVMLDQQAIAELATSEKIGDRCLAAGLDEAAAKAEPSGPDGESLYLSRDSWLEIRDGLAASCGE